MGMDVILVGPMPTPAIAMLTLSLRADIGVMISASHNTYEDNGIKLFGPDGYKLFDATEKEIEARVNSDITADLAGPERLGHARRLDDAIDHFIVRLDSPEAAAGYNHFLKARSVRLVVQEQPEDDEEEKSKSAHAVISICYLIFRNVCHKG